MADKPSFDNQQSHNIVTALKKIAQEMEKSNQIQVKIFQTLEEIKDKLK